MSVEAAERLRELISYDHVHGTFAWRPRTGRAGAKVSSLGSSFGHVSATGYLTVRIDRKLYQAHRVAWLYYYGAPPVADIDHVNGDRLDNRIVNLRDVPNIVNRQNLRRARVDNETGVLGVTVDRRRGGFKARIQVRGRQLWLGHFSTVKAARRAYLSAKRALHAGCTI